MKRVARVLNTAGTRVVFLSGAGTSVASGIPDFRSSGGMFDTLRPELITASQQQSSVGVCSHKINYHI